MKTADEKNLSRNQGIPTLTVVIEELKNNIKHSRTWEYFREISRIKEGYQPRSKNIMRSQEGKLFTDEKSNTFQEYFSELRDNKNRHTYEYTYNRNRSTKPHVYSNSEFNKIIKNNSTC